MEVDQVVPTLMLKPFEHARISCAVVNRSNREMKWRVNNQLGSKMLCSAQGPDGETEGLVAPRTTLHLDIHLLVLESAAGVYTETVHVFYASTVEYNMAVLQGTVVIPITVNCVLADQAQHYWNVPLTIAAGYFGAQSPGNTTTTVLTQVFGTPCYMKIWDRLSPSFEREVRAYASLRHPNIARLIGVYSPQLDGQMPPRNIGKQKAERYDMNPSVCILLVELGELGTLHDRYRQADYTPRQALLDMVSICSAVDYMHGQQFIHRDLKSPNIVWATDGRLLLIDFGTCITTEEAAIYTMATGSLQWIAPEAYRGNVSHFYKSTDTWCLALVLLECLNRSYPESRNAAQIQSGFVHGFARPEIPTYMPLLSSILASATAFEHLQRTSVKNMSNSLQVCLRDYESVLQEMDRSVLTDAEFNSQYRVQDGTTLPL